MKLRLFIVIALCTGLVVAPGTAQAKTPTPPPPITLPPPAGDEEPPAGAIVASNQLDRAATGTGPAASGATGRPTRTNHVPRRRLGALAGTALVVGAALVAVAAATAIGRGEGTEELVASFETQAMGDPNVIPCPGFGPDGEKIEAANQGSFRTSREEEFALTLKLEQLVERSEGIGAAEGDWQL